MYTTHFLSLSRVCAAVYCRCFYYATLCLARRKLSTTADALIFRQTSPSFPPFLPRPNPMQHSTATHNWRCEKGGGAIAKSAQGWCFFVSCSIAFHTHTQNVGYQTHKSCPLAASSFLPPARPPYHTAAVCRLSHSCPRMYLISKSSGSDCCTDSARSHKVILGLIEIPATIVK
jgi:hypothetical protein